MAGSIAGAALCVLHNHRKGGTIRLKVLILSCSTGQGHNTAAEAVREALEARGAQCALLDPFTFKGERVALNVANAYIRNAVLAPHLFGALYKIGGLISSSRLRSPVYWANTRYAKELYEHIVNESFDAVVTSHLYPAEALSFLKRRKRLPVPFYTVMTDYDCSPFWEETIPERCFTPSEEVSQICVRRGMPPERLIATGIPVRASAHEQIGKLAARSALGLAPENRLVVVMGGSMGGGRMEDVVRELLGVLDDTTHLAALCGSNRRLARRLKRRFAGEERMQIVGYTKQAALWMEACDVLLTKPGGLTSTEAAVKNVPLVLTAPIPGCETLNAAYFQRHGLASRAFAPKRAAAEALRMLEDEQARETMLRCQREQVPARAAEAIADHILRG